MRSIGIRELKAGASRIVGQVAEDGVAYTVTRRGRPVGVLLPCGAPIETRDISEDAWNRFEELADRIGAIRKPKRSALKELAAIRR